MLFYAVSPYGVKEFQAGSYELACTAWDLFLKSNNNNKVLTPEEYQVYKQNNMKTFELQQELAPTRIVTIKNLEFRPNTKTSFYIDVKNDAVVSVLSKCRIPFACRTIDNIVLIKLENDHYYDKVNTGIVIVKHIPKIVAREI